MDEMLKFRHIVCQDGIQRICGRGHLSSVPENLNLGVERLSGGVCGPSVEVVEYCGCVISK